MPDADSDGAGARSAVLLEQAARWHERALADPSPETLAGLTDWLSDDLRHQAAYEDVQAAWRTARSFAETAEIEDLRRSALGRARARTRPRTQAIGVAAALLVAVAGGWMLSTSGLGGRLLAGPHWQQGADATVYTTRVGQRLNIALADGSKVALNTGSRLRVRFTPSERSLTLDRGQAFFSVAKDPNRPFVVNARDRQIVAHGTQFDVRVDPERMRVALLEGKVTVQRQGAPPSQAVTLKPNDLLVGADATTSVFDVGKTDYLTGWRDGMLVFNDETLDDSVAEINRYVDRPIVVADAGLGRLRISGAFKTGDTKGFLEAIRAYFPTSQIREESTRTVLSTRQ